MMIADNFPKDDSRDEYDWPNETIQQFSVNEFTCFGIKCQSERGVSYEIKQMMNASYQLYCSRIHRFIKSFRFSGTDGICYVETTDLLDPTCSFQNDKTRAMIAREIRLFNFQGETISSIDYIKKLDEELDALGITVVKNFNYW